MNLVTAINEGRWQVGMPTPDQVSKSIEGANSLSAFRVGLLEEFESNKKSIVFDIAQYLISKDTFPSKEVATVFLHSILSYCKDRNIHLIEERGQDGYVNSDASNILGLIGLQK